MAASRLKTYRAKRDFARTSEPAGADAPVAAGNPCASAAVVLAIAPASGPSGSVVTITGSGLACTTGVLFGDTPALGYSVEGDGQITARAPISAPGDVDVRVLSSAGASAIVPGDRFTFTAASTGPLAPFTGPLAPIGDGRVPICGRVPTLTRYTLAQARRVLARDRCDVRLRIGGSAPRRDGQPLRGLDLPDRHLRADGVRSGDRARVHSASQRA